MVKLLGAVLGSISILGSLFMLVTILVLSWKPAQSGSLHDASVSMFQRILFWLTLSDLAYDLAMLLSWQNSSHAVCMVQVRSRRRCLARL